MSLAGYPMTLELSGIFFTTPLPPAIWTLLPIFICPEIPDWPPIETLSPISELPAKPTCPVIMQFSPILTLWAMWTWLSMKVFVPIIVFETEPLSIVLLHPISTLSFIITIPIWGILIFFFLSGRKPKPFFPIIVPSSILTLLPIKVFLKEHYFQLYNWNQS